MRKLTAAIVGIIGITFAICWHCTTEELLAASYRAAFDARERPVGDAAFVPVGQTLPPSPPGIRAYGT